MAVVVMARAPRTDACRMRPEPGLGPDGCTTLQAALISHTTRWASDTGRRVWLAYEPAGAADETAALVPEGVRCFAQAEGDLGLRLEDAVARIASQHAGPVVAIGTNCPTLGPRELNALEFALDGGWDACLLAAADGGYVGIALARPLPSAFGLPSGQWGTAEALDRTLALLRRQGLAVTVLATLA